MKHIKGITRNHLSFNRERTAKEASRYPATGGTKEILPGLCLPVGESSEQIPCAGNSVLKTTGSF